MLPPTSVHELNGLPVYASDIATTFMGTLTLGVGRRDETAKTAGTAHLLEHLVMLRVGKVTVAHNATTDRPRRLARRGEGARASRGTTPEGPPDPYRPRRLS